MAILKAFPLVSQKTTTTSDGRPSENSLFDCVPASIGAALLWYQGKSSWDSSINPDRLKDAAYGENYTGGTAAAAYTGICKQLGYNLYPINGSADQLLQKAHELIRSGKPVIITEPDPYVSTSLGWSHVCVLYAEAPGNLTAMDPFIAAPIQRSDSQWTALLEFNQIWVVEPLPNTGELHMLTLADPMGQFFADLGGSRWHCKDTSVDLSFGHLEYYRRYEGIFGLPLTNELYLSQLPGTAIVVYERAIAIYDPDHKVDNQPGAGSVYLMHINSGVGQQIVAKPLLVELQAQIDQFKQQVQNLLSLKTDNDQLQQEVHDLTQQLQQAKEQPAPVPDTTELDTLKTRIASYQAALHQIETLASQTI